eukprot:TRINITY_DN7119_c0_g1_i4.p2 TRINITY_DN7119_c0_g1~~TRINITY_DN7119_c0_g1_i4.p2  ORF type:complete len:135 (-),score=37.26 TRINITY_DN7119_c0_g1_i4:482-886(-)
MLRSLVGSEMCIRDRTKCCHNCCLQPRSSPLLPSPAGALMAGREANVVEAYWDKAYENETSVWKRSVSQSEGRAEEALLDALHYGGQRANLLMEIEVSADGMTYSQWKRSLNVTKRGRSSVAGSGKNHSKSVQG